MDRYHVVWESDVQNDLAVIWMNAANRSFVTGAADAIDSALRVNPRSKGTDLGDGLLGLAIDPLYVIFEVVDEDRFVRLLAVTSSSLE